MSIGRFELVFPELNNQTLNLTAIKERLKLLLHINGDAADHLVFSGRHPLEADVSEAQAEKIRAIK